MTRFDVHQHLIPPAYRRLLDDAGLNAGGWPLPEWSPAAAIASMDRRGTATAILSLSAPGVHFGDDAQARRVAREVNEYHAELVKDRPDRFGQFAAVPLPDVDGSLNEITYCLDELAADGVVLLSNAGGRYLGDEAYAPLWAELDSRAATVFIHPTSPPLPMLAGMPGPLLDFPYDTTRTALHMTVNGVMSDHPNIKVILSHAGGFLPYAAYRFVAAAQFNPGTTPTSIMADLRKFYFDTALSASPTCLPSLLAFAAPERILYGSDFPFAPDDAGMTFDSALDGYPHFAPGQLDDINRRNAAQLFPRLRRARTSL
jgi:6-methylsalicylate decarboxylase